MLDNWEEGSEEEEEEEEVEEGVTVFNLEGRL